MSSQPRHSPQSLISLVTLLAALASMALIGCGDYAPAPTAPGGGGAGATGYSGTITGSGVGGVLTLTIATSTPAPQPGPARARGTVTASGTLVLAGGGGTVNLTGTYDDVENIITLAGGGWSLTGGLTDFGMEGVFGGPGGASGIFSVLLNGIGANEVRVVLGTFTSTTGGPGGQFNFSVKGTVIHGNAFETGAGSAIPLDGTFTVATGAVSIVNPADPLGPPLATGTLDINGQADGLYNDGAGEAGTWTGIEQ